MSEIKTLVICLSDAVIDLIMISTADAIGTNHFTISCISGERSPDQVELEIRRDNEILKFPRRPNFKVTRPRNNEVKAKDFRDLDNIGIFYCKPTQEDAPFKKITMINNFAGGVLTCHANLTLPPKFSNAMDKVLSVVMLCVFFYWPYSKFHSTSPHYDCQQRRDSSPQHGATQHPEERCDLEVQW